MTFDDVMCLKTHQLEFEYLAFEAKADFHDAAAAYVAEAVDAERVDRINDVYWGSDAKISLIAEACGLTLHKVNKLIRPVPTGKKCGGCGAEFMAHSRTRLKEIDSNKWHDPSCKDCRTRENTRCSEQRAVEKNLRLKELSRLRTMPYSEYLQTEHWKGFARYARKRAGFRCQLCNSNKASLNVHHRTYENRGCEHYPDVIVLCKPCHEKFHNIGERNA